MARNADLRAEIERLRAALAPFAAVDLGEADPPWEDDDSLHVGYAAGFDLPHFTVADVRRAAAALQEGEHDG